MYSSSSRVNGKRVTLLGRSESGTSKSSITCAFVTLEFAFIRLPVVPPTPPWSFSDGNWFGLARRPMLDKFSAGDLLASQFSLTTGFLIFGLGSQRTQERFCSTKWNTGWERWRENELTEIEACRRRPYWVDLHSHLCHEQTHLELGCAPSGATLSILGMSNHRPSCFFFLWQQQQLLFFGTNNDAALAVGGASQEQKLRVTDSSCSNKMHASTFFFLPYGALQ